MEDETTTPPAATEGNPTEPTTPPASTETPAKPEDALGEGGKKALDAERAARKAAETRARAAEARAKEFEDAQKTDAEKMADRLAEATKKAARADRLEAALKTGLAVDLIDRLKGETLDELVADAESLKAIMGGGTSTTTEPGATPPPTVTPGSLDGGVRAPAPPTQTGLAGIETALAEARAKGDTKAVMRLNAMKLAAAQLG